MSAARASRNLAASVRQRLLDRARARGERNRLDAPALDAVVDVLASFVEEPLKHARQRARIA